MPDSRRSVLDLEGPAHWVVPDDDRVGVVDRLDRHQHKTGMSAAFSVLTTKTFDFVSLPAEDPRDRTTSKDRTSLDAGTAPPPTVDTTPGPTT